MDWQTKFGTKKLRKEFEKERKKEVEYFLKKKWLQLKKLRKELEKNWKENGKKLKLREKFRKNVGKIGEKKVEKKRRKNSMVVKNSYMSVQ